VDADIAPAKLIHRGKYKMLSARQRRGLKRRQAVEPVIGHIKADHGLRRCWLNGATGDALHVVLCAAGFNLRGLLRAIVRMGITPVWLRCRPAIDRVFQALASFMADVVGAGLPAQRNRPRWFALRIRFRAFQLADT
jgi:hypothetical protein